MDLIEISKNDELLEVARFAIEARLVELRDSRISMLARGNGLVIKESDGSGSPIIRFGPETAMRIGLEAIAEHLEEKANG